MAFLDKIGITHSAKDVPVHVAAERFILLLFVYMLIGNLLRTFFEPFMLILSGLLIFEYFKRSFGEYGDLANCFEYSAMFYGLGNFILGLFDQFFLAHIVVIIMWQLLGLGVSLFVNMTTGKQGK